MFYHFQTYNSHFINEEVGKCNFKINYIPKVIKKYMNFTIKKPKKKSVKLGNSLVFIDSIHFLNKSIVKVPIH